MVAVINICPLPSNWQRSGLPLNFPTKIIFIISISIEPLAYKYSQSIIFFSTMKPFSEQIDPKFMIQAQKLARYTQLLHQVLPIECRGHVEVANIRNQNLMLITDSPVWTTRLRQLSPQILQFIGENRPNTDTSNNKMQIIHHVQISTRYNPNNAHQATPHQQQISPEKKRQRPHISEISAELLAQSANSIDHQQLKTALLRVARHADPDTGNQSKTKNSTTED